MYSNKFVQGKIFNENQLCIRTKQSLTDKLYDGCVIFDAEGYKYQVISYKAQPKIYVTLVNVIDGVFDLLLRPKNEYSAWIDFNLLEGEKHTFSECKKEIASLVKANPKWFKKSYEDFNSIDDKLASYGSFEELIMCLAGYP